MRISRQAKQLQQLLRLGDVLCGRPLFQRDRQQHVVDDPLPLEQGGRLEHEAELRSGSQKFVSLQADFSGVWVQQTGGEFQQGGLAAAAAPHQAMELAFTHGPVHAPHHWRPARVGEAHVVEVEDRHPGVLIGVAGQLVGRAFGRLLDLHDPHQVEQVEAAVMVPGRFRRGH